MCKKAARRVLSSLKEKWLTSYISLESPRTCASFKCASHLKSLHMRSIAEVTRCAYANDGSFPLGIKQTKILARNALTRTQCKRTFRSLTFLYAFTVNVILQGLVLLAGLLVSLFSFLFVWFLNAKASILFQSNRQI